MKLQNFVLLQASAPSSTSLFYSPSKSARWGDKNANFVCKAVVFSPVRSRKSLRSQYFDKNVSKGHSSIQPCCSSSLCANFGEQYDREGFEKRFSKNEGCCAIFESRYSRKDSFLPSKFESLEPRMLGIKPEPPYWPEREAILWTNIEQKAKSFGLPLSLRMIKKKLQWESGNFRDLKQTNSCTSKAFSSLVFIVMELQTYALQMRESMCNEDLETIIAKVQGEKYASFVWLFRQVFSRTPTLMIYVMILLANYSVYSASQNFAVVKPVPQIAYDHETTTIGGRHNQQHVQIYYPHIVPEEVSNLADEEIGLWDSIEDEALNMRGLRDIFGLDHEVMIKFVSPLSVEIEPDNNVDYFKTDLLYQFALSHEPYNTLLLCNYAQFLKVIARDYNRAEECFKRAVQVEPLDAEVLCQYANFLWTVRKDLWGAEERYQQALAAEPRNSYYASTYANFLWNTGGEETCFLPSITTSFNNKNGEEV
ncbi:hypothetical protein K7X08_030383 [Anisodus acutangulus]|uniref:Uncharacterized protein n=1 Tax=Anisodus acutangulus TaxID=402998 RepID=A0A9Q1LPP6_9SOLA|nr:hypothetical protein K7X08_030383 [Anisodus acutangulus]